MHKNNLTDFDMIQINRKYIQNNEKYRIFLSANTFAIVSAIKLDCGANFNNTVFRMCRKYLFVKKCKTVRIFGNVI